MDFDSLECDLERQVGPPIGEAALTLRGRVRKALNHTHPIYAPPQPEDFVAQFEVRWGACTISTLANIARRSVPRSNGASVTTYVPSERIKDSEIELLNVLFLLGVRPTHPDVDEARAALVPFLSSPRPLERWASAISLGHLRDPQSLPVLSAMLTEYMPTDNGVHDLVSWDQYKRSLDGVSVQYHLEEWRREEVPHLLWRMGDRAVIPSLRNAVLKALDLERLLIPPADDDTYWHRSRFGLDRIHWINYQDELIYALGRLGSFGSLMGVAWPEEDFHRFAVVADGPDPESWKPEVSGNAALFRGCVWRVHLCRAFLGRKYVQHGYVLEWDEAPQMRQEVMRMLHDHYGLTAPEQEEALAYYEDSVLLSAINIRDLWATFWMAETGVDVP